MASAQEQAQMTGTFQVFCLLDVALAPMLSGLFAYLLCRLLLCKSDLAVSTLKANSNSNSKSELRKQLPAAAYLLGFSETMYRLRASQRALPFKRVLHSSEVSKTRKSSTSLWDQP